MYRLAKILMLLGLGWASGAAQAYLIQVSQGGAVLGSVQPYTGPSSASANYNLSGLAASPVNGPTPRAQQAQIWFYDGSDGLAWNVIFNAYNTGGTGSANWNINLSGNPSNANVLLSDDVGELRETPNNTSNLFSGAWRWSYLTDGGVIGPLGGSSWTLTVNPLSWSGLNINNGLSVYGPGGSITLLLNTAPIVFTPLLNGIPEPASALLLASGLVVTLAWRRRKVGRQLTAAAC